MFRTDPLQARPPGGEQISDVETRTIDALRELIAANPTRTVVAVSHEVPIRLVLARLLGVKGAEVWRLHVPTGSVARLDDEDGELRVVDQPGVT